MIDILMATYNGEKFLQNQILSLQMQTYKDWNLLIHDDGSTDKTIEIINKLQLNDNRIHLIQDGIIKKNPGYNFLHLLQYSKAEFCIFCDQDDIWLENKLEVMLNQIMIRNNNIPQAVYSNAFVYNNDTGDIDGKATLTFPKKLNEVLFMNGGIQGCAIMFNNRLRDKCLVLPPSVAMHDHLVTLVAVTLGEFFYINKRLMLYRRYQGTTTSLRSKSRLDKIYSFFAPKRTIIDKKHYEAALSYYELYKPLLKNSDKELFEEYRRFPCESIFGKIYSIYRNKFSLFDSRLILVIKVLFREPIN